MTSRLFSVFLIVSSMICLAQSQQIKTGSAVYIEPMNGYETYLAAAFAKKKVPLIVVADKSKADYLITSSVSHYTPSQPAVVVHNSNVNNTTVNSSDVTNNNNGNEAFETGFQMAAARQAARGSTSASVSVIDTHSSQIVFAYAVGKAGSTNQIQSAAEACAKHLKEFIEKQEKQPR
jgi:hypothetical protein